MRQRQLLTVDSTSGQEPLPFGFNRRLRSNTVQLSALRPEVKAQLWRGMKFLAPARAATMQALNESAEVQLLKDRFGAGFFLTDKDFRCYMNAGKQTNNQG